MPGGNGSGKIKIENDTKEEKTVPERIFAALGTWKFILTAVVGIFMGGSVSTAYVSRLASKDELASAIKSAVDRQEHEALTTKETIINQLGTHDMEIAKNNMDIGELKGALDVMSRTLYMIAIKQGLKVQEPPTLIRDR